MTHSHIPLFRPLLCALPLLWAACQPAKHAAAETLLRLHGGPDAARVQLDETPLGTLGELRRGGVRMGPGSHRLSVEADDCFPFDELVEAPKEGGVLERHVELTPLPSP